MGKLSFFVLLILALALPQPVSAVVLDDVVVDPGHGGYDTGIRGPEIKEKDITLSIAREMKAILESLDREVVLTRKIDRYLSIEERRAAAGRGSPDLFISLHLSDSEAFAVYIMWYEKRDSQLSMREYYALSSRQRRHLKESAALARELASTLKYEFGTPVYQRKMPLPVLGSIGAPAVFIEVPSRGIDYKGEMGRVAGSMVLGILRYEEKIK
jgi:N-acetylmuramoyl-L-alanine amidase